MKGCDWSPTIVSGDDDLTPTPGHNSTLSHEQDLSHFISHLHKNLFFGKLDGLSQNSAYSV